MRLPLSQNCLKYCTEDKVYNSSILPSYIEGRTAMKGKRWRELLLGTCIAWGGAVWKISG